MPSPAILSTKAHNSGLSVIIPFRNEEGTLAEMVREQLEALAQAQCPFEVILVDDASTDRSATVAESMARQTSSVRLLRHAVNLGIAGGLLTGARAASFDCVLLIPVDNPLNGETLLAFLRAGEQVDVVSGWRGNRRPYRRWIFEGFRQRFTRIAGLPELLQHAAGRGARFREIPGAARRRAAGRATATRPPVVLKTGIPTRLSRPW